MKCERIATLNKNIKLQSTDCFALLLSLVNAHTECQTSLSAISIATLNIHTAQRTHERRTVNNCNQNWSFHFHSFTHCEFCFRWIELVFIFGGDTSLCSRVDKSAKSMSKREYEESIAFEVGFGIWIRVCRANAFNQKFQQPIERMALTRESEKFNFFFHLKVPFGNCEINLRHYLCLKAIKESRM